MILSFITAIVPSPALAADADANSESPALVAATPVPVRSGNVLYGGETIEADGDYTLADGATGVITISEEVNARVFGCGIDEGFYTDLSFDVGDSAALTISGVYVKMPTNQGAIPFIEFNGMGTLNIEGTNRVEMGDENNVAALHVVLGDEVHLGGTGKLYGYKGASSPFIGVNMGTPDTVPFGDVVFDGGTWYLAGTKMGPVIGNDLVAGTDSAPMGTVTVNNGATIFAKSMSQGAVIGGSKNGVACNVVVNGGLMELFTDYNASTIGAGGAVAHGSDYLGFSGTVVFNGGSVKTTISKNGYGSSDSGNVWAGEGLVWTSSFAQVSDATITAAHNTKLLVFDAAEYANTENTGSESLSAYVDGALFYQGGLYPSLTSELKNPANGDTLARWLANGPESAYPEGTVTDGSVYPPVAASTFAPDYNLYFHLTPENHTLVVNGNQYAVMWDGEAGAFSYSKAGSGEPAVSYGDVDGNGKVNAIDATLVRRYAYKQIELAEAQLAAAEVSGDDKVNAIDATLILRYAYRQIDSFPAEA